MARIRSIKPDFFTSLTIAELSPHARLTFIGLWTYVDDDGRGIDDARLIRAAVWPLEEDPEILATIRDDLAKLREASLIRRYTVAGKPYLAVASWHEHQKVDKPRKSRFPGPDDAEAEELTSENEPFPEDSPKPREEVATLREDVDTEQGAGSREQGSISSSAAEQPTQEHQPREDVERLCLHLADRVERNGAKRPTITKRWRDAARLLIDADGRSEEQIRKAIDWCQDDEFWRSNILSMPKLREKYDQLRLKAWSRDGPHLAAANGATDRTHLPEAWR